MTVPADPELSVVIMAFNEAATVERTCDEIHAVLTSLGRSFEIVIVDDGSHDGTGEAAEAIARKVTGVRVIHHAANQGLGGVYRTGFRSARGRCVTFFPADGQFPPEIIRDFAGRMHDVELVLGYLHARPGAWLGRALSLVERWIYRAMFGRLPRFQGIMMLRRELLARFPLVSDGRGWAVVMEFIIRAVRSGARVVSVPTGYRPRTHGSSKVNNWRTIRANLQQVIVLWRQLRAERV